MAKLTKRMQAIQAQVVRGKSYPAEEAFVLLRELSKVKFAESVDVAVNLGVDPRKSDQVVRGATVLPNGIGKTVRVAVFAQGAAADAANGGRCRPGRHGRSGRRGQGRADGLRRGHRLARTPCAWSASLARSWVPAA